MMGTGIEDCFPLRRPTAELQRSLTALKYVDIFDLLSLNPADENVTNLGFIKKRIRTMMAFFHPDKAEISKAKLQYQPLPPTHDYWQELHDFKELLAFSDTTANKLLLALQERIASAPKRWKSTWNFDAILDKTSSPFQPIPSFIGTATDTPKPSPKRTRSQSPSPGNKRQRTQQPRGENQSDRPSSQEKTRKQPPRGEKKSYTPRAPSEDSERTPSGGPQPSTEEKRRAAPQKMVERLVNLRLLANNSEDGRVAVAVISQPRRPRQLLGPKQWVVFATKLSSGIRYKVGNVNLHGENIGSWNWQSTSMITDASEIEMTGRWVGPFAKWGGDRGVKRYFKYRKEHGCDPGENEDSMEDN
jgi:hypothetical protein